MSIHPEEKSRINTTASMLIIEKGECKVLLYDIFDDLTSKKKRDIAKTTAWSMLVAGFSGIVHWFIEDVATADSLIDYNWLCTEPIVYSVTFVIGLLIYMLLILNEQSEKAMDKATFVKRYMEKDSFQTLDRFFQISATPATPDSGVSFNTKSSEESE